MKKGWESCNPVLCGGGASPRRHGAKPHHHTVVSGTGYSNLGSGLVRQGLICTEQQPDAGAVAQLRQQRRGGVQVSSIGVGRLGPDRFIDNLCRFFRVHVESSFQSVGLLAGLAVAAMANRGRFGGPAMLVLENAPERGCGVDLSGGSEGLWLEFFQEALAIVVDPCSGRRLRQGGRLPT